MKRVAFVTGAASGLGLATARAYLKAGYATVLADNDQGGGTAAMQALETHGDLAFARCDVTDDMSVRAAVAFTVERFGRLDAAFNSAGIEGENKPLLDSSRAHFDRVVSVNLAGVWNSMKHELRQMMVQGGGGTIVNCSSGAGLQGIAGNAAYAASKHGVIGLTRSVALEYASAGIRVNAVCPGLIDTPMTARALPLEYVDQVVSRIPRRRMGMANDIAATVLWLSSEGADYVVGQAISVDGGASVA